MQYFKIMQSLESSGNLNSDAPNFIFSELSAAFGMIIDFIVKISVVGKLHDDATWEEKYYKKLELCSIKLYL